MTSTLKLERALLPPNEYFAPDQPTVKVYVGPKRTCWVLPEGFICDRIEFFSAAFKGNFKEGCEKEIYLEEDDPAAFGRLIDFLFRNFLQCDIGCEEDHEACPYQKDWCALYILADKWSLTDLPG